MEGLLKELSDPTLSLQDSADEEKRRFADIIEEIYADGYRLCYSDIQRMIVHICREEYYSGFAPEDDGRDDPEAEKYGDSEALGFNLDALIDFIRRSDGYDDRTFMSAYKLGDHVKIEIQRFRDNTGMMRSIDAAEHRIMRAEARARKLETSARDLKDELETAETNAQSLQMHMVGILGVFAAIAMVFSGGLDMISGAMAASKEVPVFQTAFVVLLCGMVVFNIVAFLMVYIERIMTLRERRSLPVPRGKPWDRVKRCFLNNTSAVAVNGMLIACIVADCCLWVGSGTFPMV